MTQIFFDESGNTGQNLIDEVDPIFVLASCSFIGAEEQELISHFRDFKGPELKFSRLRKTATGQKAMLNFIGSPAMTPKTVAAFVIHKPFMVVTKYCDLVLEPSFRESGVDFYERGMNIALANMLTAVMPVILNPATWSNFLSLFVRVIRERTPKVFSEWRNSAELIYSYLEHKNADASHYFAPVFLIKNCEDFFRTVNADELDPVIPSYHTSVDHWGKSLGCYFEVIADASKVLAKERARLLAFSNTKLKPVNVGYDRRKIEFPLKVSDIVVVDSKTTLQVQFADVISGAIASALKARLKRPLQQGTFVRDSLELCFSKNLIIGGVWPTNEIDPEDLGTEVQVGPDDVDAASYAALILKGHPATKKTENQK